MVILISEVAIFHSLLEIEQNVLPGSFTIFICTCLGEVRRVSGQSTKFLLQCCVHPADSSLQNHP